MAITLGSVLFDETHTTVKERHEEVGGRDERKIEISGLIVGESSLDDVTARLDGILGAASDEDYTAALSLRTGRRLYVRREKFAREISVGALVGSFELLLAAKDPFEISEAERSEVWTVSASGATRTMTVTGNVYSHVNIAVTAVGNLVNPAFSDGIREIAYSGVVAAGSVLEFDGEAGRVRINGDDVTPYSTGEFPRIAPEGTTFTYTDDATSSHAASVVVTLRDRWW